MIIDGHAYCFPPIAGANGFPSAAHHLRYLQREMVDHHQPNWRLSDWQVGDNAMLADTHDPTVEGNKDVNFRPGSHGRFTWTVDGEEYAKQYLPPYLVDMSHSPELLIAQMDYVGVQYAVLHVHPIFGYLNDYVADCVQRYPDRLLGLAAVPDQMVEGDPTAAVAEVVRAYDRGLRGLQFVVKSRYRFGLTQSWDSLVCRPFWDAVVALGKPIFFTIEPCPGSSLDDYLDQLQVWAGWLSRYPQASVVLTHGFPWRLLLSDNGLTLPDALFEPFRASAAKLQLLFPISIGNIWDYPYPALPSTIVQLVERLGSDRLIWGTDMPNVERFCNYRQNPDIFRVYCRGAISDAAIDDIIGGTAARLFGIQDRGVAKDT